MPNLKNKAWDGSEAKLTKSPQRKSPT